MTIDIVYLGFISNFLVKRRTKKFFQSSRFKSRNNVFVDLQKNNTYHLKKNSIHIFVSSDDPANITEICSYLKFTFQDSLFGVSTNNSIYKNFEEHRSLNWLRM